MATKTNTESPEWVQAREAMVVVLGARAPVYKTVIVRDKHTGKLAEVPLAPIEHPPLDEGDPETTYVFSKGEKVLSDHPAVLDGPHRFVPVPPRE
jgi:hypothetical protein